MLIKITMLEITVDYWSALSIPNFCVNMVDSGFHVYVEVTGKTLFDHTDFQTLSEESGCLEV